MFTDFFTPFIGSLSAVNCLYMPKLDDLKEKLTAAKEKLSEKLDKIALLRKWREKKAASTPRPPSPYSLGEIYRSGGTGTRIQVIFVYVLFICALGATIQASRKMYKRLGSSAEHEKLKEDYSHGLTEMAQKVVENANLISLGKFTSRVFSQGSGGKMMGVDIWVRVSDPETAAFAQKNEAILHDRIVDALNEIYVQEIDPLSQKGRAQAKGYLQESMNKALPSGKVEDIFFQNMIVQ